MEKKKVTGLASKYDEIGYEIITKINMDLDKIRYVENLQIINFLNKLSDLKNHNKDEVFYSAINLELSNLKKKINVKIYKQITHKIDNITDYFYLDHIDNKDDVDEVIRIGDEISDDILFDILENNYCPIDIPISKIKNECLKKKIKKKYVYDVLLWILLRYITINNYVDHKENYESK